MADFIRIGNKILNLDLVTTIEDHLQAGQDIANGPCCIVHDASGRHHPPGFARQDETPQARTPTGPSRG